ncbi:acyl-CoA dehydrogenase [Cohnella boryungensis]|uniref:Acyl-CoA dehydrogenase n=1 Tax=Cohnella boryungensis TaxID=768479 RepID=A0ABV8S7D3_9BACL
MSVIIPQSIASEVRANARLNQGVLTPGLLAYLYEAKLFKLFVPEQLNGLMLPLPDALRVFEQASRIDGSFGWLVTIGSGGGFFSAALPPAQARELFSGANAVVAGSGHANGLARPVEGGYLVDGEWPYCSGSTYASLYTANCRIEGMKDDIRSFAFLPDQVEVIPDWNSFGLRGTESHSIAVKGAFVPAERTFSIMSEPHYDDAIFRYPFLPFAQTSFAAVCLGICRHFLEEARAFIESRREVWETARLGRYANADRVVAGQTAGLETDGRNFYEAVERTWAAFEDRGRMSDAEQAEVGEACQRLASHTLEYANIVFRLLGMAVLMEDHPINRIWRDLHTVAQHSVLVPASADES